MQATIQQPRLFIIGYARPYRLELAEAFRDQDYEVLDMKDIQLALYALNSMSPDVVIMDWTTDAPMSTLAFVERYASLMPVLIHTQHGALMDVVQGLRAGAADYIRMPCFFPELLARVERAQASSPGARELSIGGLSLNVRSGVAHIGDTTVEMTGREARILAALMQCPEHSVSRNALMRVAGINTAKATIIESYIKQLRKRHDHLRRSVRTRYGKGYGYFPESAT
jgi:DNA-binding response OmpR family regulator